MKEFSCTMLPKVKQVDPLAVLLEPFQRFWVLAITLLDATLFGAAFYFENNGHPEVAGITVTIALFVALFTAVVYAAIWWLRQV
ncbi:hypothetical protein [Halomicrococcus sp. SG-WS-1]|uniref:hypothetical protein n=1 Tax=Halomicrococcus sp. SG-WS-1 TaxID=3439057 RepID=UPI003F7A3857